jgi:hypothetical protein
MMVKSELEWAADACALECLSAQARPELKIHAAITLIMGIPLHGRQAARVRLRDARPGVRGVSGYNDQNARRPARTPA